MSKTNILNKVENKDVNKFFILTKALQTIFISYGVNENKTLKLQLQNLFNFIDKETEEAINELINNYDCFSEHEEQ